MNTGSQTRLALASADVWARVASWRSVIQSPNLCALSAQRQRDGLANAARRTRHNRHLYTGRSMITLRFGVLPCLLITAQTSSMAPTMTLWSAATALRGSQQEGGTHCLCHCPLGRLQWQRLPL